ncbi:restriction endonuclease subunit S [Hydrogenophaga sp. SL48]|nr:restriction endonuclease subunit S [Hydrogenophaga sp. SL48]
MSTVRTYLKAVANFPEAQPGLIASTGFAVLRPNGRLRPRFAYWAALSEPFIENVVAHSEGVSYPAINPSVLGSLHLPVPSLTEQERIANFLDDKTARIDALIAEKERLVEHLDAGGFDLLHQAVTKGLKPTRLTNSRREWMGAIPEHWSAPYIKFVAQVESGHTPSRQVPEYWENCHIPWFGLSDVWQIRDGVKEVVAETSELISDLGLANSSARLLPSGTVILSRTASVGFSAIMGVPMATTQDFVNWICGPKVLPDYLLYVFRSMRSEFERLKFGSTHSTIYMPDIAKMALPLPPLEEQREIVAFARERKKRLEELKGFATAELMKLREYRTSLISAAVAGQLDVGSFEAAKA